MAVLNLTETISFEENKNVPKCKQLSRDEKMRLFEKYIIPNYDTIKSLTKYYTDNYQDVDENFNNCLVQLYSYIGSYNPAQKLKTWLHICVKRSCYCQNKKRAEEAQFFTDVDMCPTDILHQNGNSMVVEAGFGNLMDNLSDQMLEILMMIPPNRLSPFLLHVQGVRIRDITAAEWESGHLEKKSEAIVKSRIFWAKKELQYLLRRHGIARESYTSESINRNRY